MTRILALSRPRSFQSELSRTAEQQSSSYDEGPPEIVSGGPFNVLMQTILHVFVGGCRYQPPWRLNGPAGKCRELRGPLVSWVRESVRANDRPIRGHGRGRNGNRQLLRRHRDGWLQGQLADADGGVDAFLCGHAEGL